MQDQRGSPIQRPAAPGSAIRAGGRQVNVPGYAGTLAPRSPQRVRALRRHLIEAMREMREMRHMDRVAESATPDPPGFRGRVARAACALCNGWCCSKGGDHAYIDERTMARVRRARPELDARGVLLLYAQSAADPAYAGSCVFHGAQGCTLDRSLRSDLCNAYYCNGLSAWIRGAELARHVTVMAGSGATVRLADEAR